jgi:hypothetical protein
VNCQKNHIDIYGFIEDRITEIGVDDRVVIDTKKCEICNNQPKKDFGYCKNLDGEGDLYDCCDWVDKSWMVSWIRKIKEENKKPYVSDFCKWSKNN